MGFYDTWTMRNGKNIKIKDMTTEHIENTIRAIQEGRALFPKRMPIDAEEADIWYDIRLEYLTSLSDELDKRDDGGV